MQIEHMGGEGNMGRRWAVAKKGLTQQINVFIQHTVYMKSSEAELLKGLQLQGTQDFGTQSVRTKTSHKWAKKEGQDTKQRHLETI